MKQSASFRHRPLVGVAAVVAAAAAAMLLAGSARPAFAFRARAPLPVQHIPLETLGFPGYTVALMHAGASMETVHLLDNDHLLFTYSLRTLVPRLAGDVAEDEVREVAAEIVEIPSGKVLERTKWHLHDHGRYLWEVGRGVFVLRSGDQLSLFAPLRGLAEGHAFERTALPHRPGHPALITGSPDGEIVTVELQSEPTHRAAGDQVPVRKRTTLEFFRVGLPTEPAQPVEFQRAGAVGAPGLMALALDGDGYLWAEDGGRGDWKVSFNEYGGAQQALADVRSQCTPHLQMLSRSEFAVLACSSAIDDSTMLSAYGFDGHENWQEPLGEELRPPTFAMAPAAGRFAISRLSANGNGTALESEADNPLSQQVRVYGTESGDLLLQVLCDPVERSAENFDLSPDGRRLAVLGVKSLDIYELPALTAADRKAMVEVEAMRPPLATGPVQLTRITHAISPEGEGSMPGASQRKLLTANGEAVPIPADEDDREPATGTPADAATATTAGAPAGAGMTARDTTAANPRNAGAQAPEPARPAAASAVSSAASPATAEANGTENGDGAPRKPPTLLNPGEKAEYRPAGTSPQ